MISIIEFYIFSVFIFFFSGGTGDGDRFDFFFGII
jgi:hypothetical protein